MSKLWNSKSEIECYDEETVLETEETEENFQTSEGEDEVLVVGPIIMEHEDDDVMVEEEVEEVPEKMGENTFNQCSLSCGDTGLHSVEDHQRLCVEEFIPCPFSDFGCGCDYVPQGALVDHMTQQGPRHSMILLQSMSNLGNELKRLETINNDRAQKDHEHIISIENEIRTLKFENEFLRRQISENNNRPSEETESESSLINIVLQRLDLKYEKKYYEYLWRVPNFKSLVTNAKLYPTKKEVSNPFFTSKNSYRIQLILYPNGFGNAKDQYISLFYQIIKDKFDDLLSWPFRYNVELRLLDQDGAVNDQVLNVFFDPSDSEMMKNYSRPLGDDVCLYGSEMFVSKQVMSTVPSLRKNDTLFFKFCAKPVSLGD